jgi:hypothetical protein
MTVLWYAIGIYMVGIAIVLYVRPRIMFRENGMWKEFGLATEADQTICPFWMFAIVWAILSYALGNLISIFFASVALSSLSEGTSNTVTSANANTSTASTSTTNTTIPNTFMQPITQYPNAAPQFPTFAPNPPSMPKSPGYYILDPYAAPTHPRYIYYGPEPPGITPLGGQ